MADTSYSFVNRTDQSHPFVKTWQTIKILLSTLRANCNSILTKHAVDEKNMDLGALGHTDAHLQPLLEQIFLPGYTLILAANRREPQQEQQQQQQKVRESSVLLSSISDSNRVNKR